MIAQESALDRITHENTYIYFYHQAMYSEKNRVCGDQQNVGFATWMTAYEKSTGVLRKMKLHASQPSWETPCETGMQVLGKLAKMIWHF